jgi:hypothetical protein
MSCPDAMSPHRSSGTRLSRAHRFATGSWRSSAVSHPFDIRQGHIHKCSGLCDSYGLVDLVTPWFRSVYDQWRTLDFLQSVKKWYMPRTLSGSQAS